jgi:hypothetical protein
MEKPNGNVLVDSSPTVKNQRFFFVSRIKDLWHVLLFARSTQA